MLFSGWQILLLLQLFRENSAQDDFAKETCNTRLDLSSGEVKDFLESKVQANLGSDEESWCFTNNSIASQTAILILTLNRAKFVSGFATQGPPENVREKTYNHLIAFVTSHSMDAVRWMEFNSGNLFFSVDKNDTSDVIDYHTSSTIELAMYVKINVTMQISGTTDICLRLGVYGCDTEIRPSARVQATTTDKGKIKVKWQPPVLDTTIEPDAATASQLKPNGYVAIYRPLESQSSITVATSDETVYLDDVRLGATYVIQLECLVKDVVISCGSAQIDAYPPCPDEWTGGNEYHCFLYVDQVSSFLEARSLCLSQNIDKRLGNLGYLVDENERRFLGTKILPSDVIRLWLVSDKCQEDENCCKVLQANENRAFEEVECETEEISSAVCLWDHKGEGARLRISNTEALEDGSSVRVRWHYEGTGWKTDELQVKLWTDDAEKQEGFTFSTLDNVFQITNLGLGEMYSLLLKPAPNIRTEEFIYQFIILSFEDEPEQYGALLTPISMSSYIIWSGSLKITWKIASAWSSSGSSKPASKYMISYRSTALEHDIAEILIEDDQQFVMTPVAMRATYVFRLSCHFANVFHPCGEITVVTEPPAYVKAEPPKAYIVYEVMQSVERTWTGAEEDCQQRSGHLTTFLGQEEGKILLGLLPNKSAQVWTGAKLGKQGTGYWTDGQKITDLQMAKNSGVTASSESCCRALTEVGKLKLIGGNCKDKYPYICKYMFNELLVVPSELKIISQSWNSIEISWQEPKERWLPTFYNIRACAKTTVVECVVTEEIQSQWDFKIQNLKEFTNYELIVDALLTPVNIKTTAKTSAMTYPKLPVQCMISSIGEMKLETQILVAMNKEASVIKATAVLSGATITAATGSVEEVLLAGFVPEESYQIIIEEEEGEWKHEISLTAIPTCMKNDVSQDGNCLRISTASGSFEASKSTCSKEKEQPMSIWSPQKLSNIVGFVESNEITWNLWLDVSQMVEQESEPNSECSGDPNCCYYDVSLASVSCTACCDKELGAICSYHVMANLGQVSGLRPSLIGNTSIELQWSPPAEISWVIRRYEVQWSASENPGELLGTNVVEESTQLIENLEFGTEYDIVVTPIGSKILRGVGVKILITTLDPRTQLSVTVQPNGVAKIYSPVLIEKGRGADEVEVIVEIMDLPNGENKIISSKGQAENVEISGLKLGAKYKVEMASLRQDSKKFKYETKFEAYPSCTGNQIQEGMICVWATEEPKTWTEAVEACKNEEGELLDFKTQAKFSPQVKSLLSSYVKEQFWVDVPDSIKSAALIDRTSDQCPSSQESDVMCCTYETSSEGNMNDLKCTCCSEPRPFACKRIAKIDLGDIADIFVEEVTRKSLSISWSMASDAKWYKPSFVVSWQQADERRRKRESKDEVVIEDPSVKIQGLTPGTKYKVTVAPYVEGENTDGNSKEIVVSTRESEMIAGITDSWCTMTILKISCSITVILGSCFTVFVFIATRVLFLDSLAQIFSELGTVGAYLCILVSTVQSYSIDDQCRTANPKLCVVVSVLIQFFFQSIFLFMMLESTVMTYALKDYVPACCVVRSSISLMITGFGIPAIMSIVLAAVASDGFSDKSDNCWLDIEGTAMLPSIIPVIIFGVFCLFLLFSLFDADDPKKELSPDEFTRASVYLKTRWGSFAILALTTVSYGTGLMGANKRDSTLNSVFVGFSTALGILMPAIRIRCDDQVREQLKHGLFNSLRDDFGAIRVTPAPDEEPNSSIKLSELSARRHKHKQFNEFALKNKQSYTNTEIAWHQ